MPLSYVPNLQPGNNSTMQLRRRTNDLVSAANQTQAAVDSINQSGVGFPTPGSSAQMNGVMSVATAPGVANTEFPVQHHLGRVPQGYIVFGTSVGCHVYQGPTTGTPWTDTTIYIKCDQANATITLFIT